MLRLRSIALLSLIALLSACAGRPLVLPTLESLANLPEQVYLDDVPFHAQDEFQCGPASLAMLLNQRGIADQPDELTERVYIPERNGTLQVELVSAARERDLLVYPLDGRLENLMAEVAAGNPVLVMQNLAFNWFPQWHYAVVVGYDLSTREMIVHSGLNKAQREPFRVFTRTWDRAERWAIILLPPGQLPAQPTPLTYLRAASDLEQTGRLESAKRSYSAALQAWPEQPSARLGLGNLAWAAEQPEQAGEHFHQLVSDFPDFKAGWNNYSVVLNALGCEQAATLARQCAAGQSVDNQQRLSNNRNPACAIPLCLSSPDP